MGAVINPLPGKLATFLIGATSYQFSKWSLSFTLNTGEVLHFNSQQDGNSNYWPTRFVNFATGEGQASGAVDHNNNFIPIGAGLYIGSTGTATLLHMSTDGFTGSITITKNDVGSDATSADPASIGIAFILMAPPSRIYSL